MPSTSGSETQTWRRQLGLGAATLMQIAGGNGNTFSLYSDSLKSVMGLNQRDLVWLSVANDIGENVGVLPGFLYRGTQPWCVILIGTFLCVLGYGFLWFALCQTTSFPYFLLWFVLCLGSCSNAFFSTTVLNTNIANFPHSQGKVAGILKGYSEIAGAVYTQIYSVLLNKSSCKLLAFLTFGIPALCVTMMFLVRPCTLPRRDDPEECRHFHLIQCACIFLGMTVLGVTTLDDWFPFSSLLSYVFLSLTVIFLIVPLAIPVMNWVMTFYTPSNSQSTGSLSHDDHNNPNTTVPLLGQSSKTSDSGSLPQSEHMSESSLTGKEDDNSNPTAPLLGQSSTASDSGGHPQSEHMSELYEKKDDNPNPTAPLLGQPSTASNSGNHLQSEHLSESSLTGKEDDNPNPIAPLLGQFSPASDSGSRPQSEHMSESSLSGKEDDNPNPTAPLLGQSSSASSFGRHHQSEHVSEDPQSEHASEDPQIENVSTDVVPTEGEGSIQDPRQNPTIHDALCSTNFLVLFLVSLAGVGSGVTVLSNLVEIGRAKNIDDTKFLMSLFSFSNFLGRLYGGFISEYFVRTKGFPRTIWIALTQGIMVLTYILFALAHAGWVHYAATLLLGACYGSHFSITAATASELFGIGNFGIIFNILSLSNLMGAYLFSSLRARSVHDNVALGQNSTTCVGPNCFKVTFFILAGVCFLGTLLSLCLSWNIRKLYDGLRRHESSNELHERAGA